MKKLTLLALMSPLFCMAQSHQPLDGSVSKRFFEVNEPENNDYFFYATGEVQNGNEIVWNQYFTIQSEQEVEFNENCSWWGGISTTTLDTTWLGTTIYYQENTMELQLTNEYSELLNFNFGLNLNDSALFYENDNSSWYIRLVGEEEQSVLGQNENVKHFAISAYNIGGVPLENELSDFIIQLSENLGLITFIDCYHFPNVLTGLQLSGQTNPLLGEYQLSYTDIYPWQPGDVIQYQGSRSYMQGTLTNTTYQTLSVTAREETIDSVHIYFETNTQQFIEFPGDNSVISIPLSNPISFSKNDIISDLPYNRASFLWLMSTYSEHLDEDYCSSLGQLSYEESFSAYCDSCLCFGPIDGFGNAILKKRYALNRGQIYLRSEEYGPLETQNNWMVNQIYSNIGGVECGNLFVGLDEKADIKLQVFPNPSRELINISTSAQAELMWLTDINGRVVYQTSIFQQPNTIIDVHELQAGSYFLFIRFRNDSVGREKVIIQ